MATPYTPTVHGTGVRATIQRFGGHLAGMIMPNIGAFIAWGLITALFIPTGWMPNKALAELVDPIIKVLLPVLIGYTGGRMVHAQRGAVVGAVATMGVVVGADVPMFLGAMIIGPLAALILKYVDRFTSERTRAGFEMLVDNFTAGIVGAVTAIAGVLAIGPVVEKFTDVAGSGVEWLIAHSLLPIASVIIEPAKVLFLNNAINHGVLGPLGVAESVKHGKSILFMLESNPGPGLGLLIAYLLFGPRSLRPSTPAAMIIHFFGIHEIYFPYVLMKPRLILAVVAGGASGVLTFLVTGAGLVATPSPGSIFAYMAVTPKGGWFGVIAGIVVATAVSFAVAAALLGFGRANGDKADDPAQDAVPHDTDDTTTSTNDDNRDTTGETAAESVPATKEA
ncbi:PTS mannitol transporter subunit IICB [Microbispora bryophytorum]|uniref:PTS mannitol transporter subunit IICB n=1 Tax=Microbispora bryophytorum TaxID=1460882 RepID=UPI0033FA10BB